MAIQTTSTTSRITGLHKTIASHTTVAQALVERIVATYSREQAAKDGIYYWPEPLPTPGLPLQDPLVLFRSAPDTSFSTVAAMPSSATSTLSSLGEKYEQLSVIPATLHGVAGLRDRDNVLNVILSQGADKKPDRLMYIPLGLVDLPDEQKRDTFCVDLHGSATSLSGGPLLIAGAQNSGKATALQTILLWLMTRYSPRQLRLAIIDPNRDLDVFQDMPHVRSQDDIAMCIDGSSDEQLTQFTEQYLRLITQRRENYPGQRWDDQSIVKLRERGAELPLLLLVINHYHSFEERFKAKEALKKLVLAAAEARMMGVYVIVTSAEVSAKYLPPDIVARMGTKIGLFLNDQQRYDLFGRTPGAAETIPGRGLVATRDRSVHQIQIALPVPGESESVRFEALKQELFFNRERSPRIV